MVQEELGHLYFCSHSVVSFDPCSHSILSFSCSGNSYSLGEVLNPEHFIPLLEGLDGISGAQLGFLPVFLGIQEFTRSDSFGSHDETM